MESRKNFFFQTPSFQNFILHFLRMSDEGSEIWHTQFKLQHFFGSFMKQLFFAFYIDSI